MSKVTLSGYIVVPDADLAAVEAELPRHIENTRKERGCLRFEVTRDDTDRNHFRVFEEFVDPAAFRQHQQRVAGSRWGEISRNVIRHYQVEGLE